MKRMPSATCCCGPQQRKTPRGPSDDGRNRGRSSVNSRIHCDCAPMASGGLHIDRRVSFCTSRPGDETMTQRDPSVSLRNEPMSSFQLVAVAICVALNALDGFDILAITFAAPGITREWALGPGALGIVISTGLVGMTIGSLVIGPMADT